MSIFTLASETGVTAPTLELPNYYNISDFEIYNDTVYFCGRADSGSIVALFGYFSLVSFPYSSVYCCHIQSLKELKKLAIYNNGNKPHVVFTGTMGKNKSVLSDAIISSYNSWDFAIAYDTYIDDLIFDDVAVTDDYIVSSSRIFNLDSGLIQYFHKPPTYHTMFPYYYITRSIEYNPISQILITACQKDTFATLCNVSPSAFVMSKYNPLNDVISLKSTIKRCESRDINYNADNKNVEVLVYDVGTEYGSSLTLDYDNALTMSAYIPEHRWLMQDMYSIDYLVSDPLKFIAAGREIGGVFVRLYRYKFDEWHGCTEETNIKALKIGNEGLWWEHKYQPMLNAEDAILIECIPDESDIDNKCDN